MSKRNASVNRSSFELDDEQRAALELLPDNLPPNLRYLVPVLDALRKASSDGLPPHKKT